MNNPGSAPDRITGIMPVSARGEGPSSLVGGERYVRAAQPAVAHLRRPS
jgi:hypothetical protein